MKDRKLLIPGGDFFFGDAISKVQIVVAVYRRSHLRLLTHAKTIRTKPKQGGRLRTPPSHFHLLRFTFCFSVCMVAMRRHLNTPLGPLRCSVADISAPRHLRSTVARSSCQTVWSGAPKTFLFLRLSYSLWYRPSCCVICWLCTSGCPGTRSDWHIFLRDRT